MVKEYWNLISLFVHPKKHSNGIGRKLIDHALELCNKLSPKGYVKLNSSSYAAPFYTKVGFTQIGEGKPLPGGCVPFEYNF